MAHCTTFLRIARTPPYAAPLATECWFPDKDVSPSTRLQGLESSIIGPMHGSPEQPGAEQCLPALCPLVPSSASLPPVPCVHPGLYSAGSLLCAVLLPYAALGTPYLAATSLATTRNASWSGSPAR